MMNETLKPWKEPFEMQWSARPDDGMRGMSDKAVAEHYYRLGWLDANTRQPAQEPVAIKLGMLGEAFDGPDTKRAYTYSAQPGNDKAWRLGEAVRAATEMRGGDFIDTGLGLLKALRDQGFGVFELGVEFPDETPPDEAWRLLWEVVELCDRPCPLGRELEKLRDFSILATKIEAYRDRNKEDQAPLKEDG